MSAEQDEVLRRMVIDLLAHVMLMKDFANLQKDCQASLLKKNETRPEMISAAMLTACRVAAEATLYRIFGSETGEGKMSKPDDSKPVELSAEQGDPPGEPHRWSETLEEMLGEKEGEKEGGKKDELP